MVTSDELAAQCAGVVERAQDTLNAQSTGKLQRPGPQAGREHEPAITDRPAILQQQLMCRAIEASCTNPQVKLDTELCPLVDRHQHAA